MQIKTTGTKVGELAKKSVMWAEGEGAYLRTIAKDGYTKAVAGSKELAVGIKEGYNK